MQTRLLLISHAATAAMRSGRFPADDPLDARGLAEVAAWREHLTPGLDEPAIFTSPAACARDTAQALGFGTETNAHMEPALADADPGRWRGRRLADIANEEPEALAAWTRDPDAAPPGGESFSAVLARVGGGLDALPVASRSDPGEIVAITHAAVIRAAIIHALGASPASFTRIEIASLSIVEVRRSIRGGWTWWPAHAHDAA